MNSTLNFITNHAQSYNITPVVTFDQPLYWKAQSVAQNDKMDDIVLRLGSFHTLMNFLGTIGKLMEGTGFGKILELLYGENTVSHISSGKAVSRALRAHELLVSCIYSVILDHLYPSLDSAVNDHTSHDFLNELRSQCELLMTTKDLDNFDSYFLEEFKSRLNNFKVETSSQRTSMLWFMYLEVTDIVFCFLRGERTGDWKMHMNAVKLMRPYLAASGHNKYVAAISLYVQQMEALPETFPHIHASFLAGNHSIWRSSRYWGGLSTDLIIEQCLMKNLKSRGGITRGRGVTDMQQAVWGMSAPVIAEINGAMQELTNTNFVTSEQHKENYNSRKKRDAEDAEKMYQFLKERSPFNLPCNLRNIVSGVSASAGVNVDRAKEIGEAII